MELGLILITLHNCPYKYNQTNYSEAQKFIEGFVSNEDLGPSHGY